ncbi:hypothetical protein [Phosphitispora sp. TUW77]|uniref:hypothetical protein n=1 Tax=Phosphitispora sp. TUW77 TaxID=3152361 RepID=UPI003AB5C331
MWFNNEFGLKVFRGGKDDWQSAADAARACNEFAEDDEDEQVADSPVSCYNCRYRRWTPTSFVCLKITNKN